MTEVVRGYAGPEAVAVGPTSLDAAARRVIDVAVALAMLALLAPLLIWASFSGAPALMNSRSC